MIFCKKTLILFIFLSLFSCADYNSKKTNKGVEKVLYSSTGFALIYNEDLYKQKIVNRKIYKNEFATMHSFLKKNTPIKIINPKNHKMIKTKVSNKSEYPKVFNIVITDKIAKLLELDYENPYVEIIEYKKNKTFVAKKSTTYNEEMNVAEKAPIDEVKIDNISTTNSTNSQKPELDKKYTLIISDFYYIESAKSLKKNLIEQTEINNYSIKKIKETLYRLTVGPFKNFSTLKSAYISLNNLGFEDLNIIRK